MKYLAVKNYRKFQSHSDGRRPIWIKLHLKLLSDYEFQQMSEPDQRHLIMIWLLAADMEQKIPYDPAYVARAIHAKGKVNLDQFISLGFLQVINPDSVVEVCNKSGEVCNKILHALKEKEEELEEEKEEDVEGEGESERETGSQVFAVAPCKNNQSFKVTASFIEEFIEESNGKAYASIDVIREIECAIDWLERNDSKRWKPSGFKAGIRSWLRRARDENKPVSRDKSVLNVQVKKYQRLFPDKPLDWIKRACATGVEQERLLTAKERGIRPTDPELLAPDPLESYLEAHRNGANHG